MDRLAQPPAAYGVILESYDDATVDILTGGRKMHVAVSPAASPKKRAELWWSDNIPDSKRLFPAPSSIRVTSIRLTKRWIYRAKAVGLKAPFEPPPE